MKQRTTPPPSNSSEPPKHSHQRTDSKCFVSPSSSAGPGQRQRSGPRSHDCARSNSHSPRNVLWLTGARPSRMPASATARTHARLKLPSDRPIDIFSIVQQLGIWLKTEPLGNLYGFYLRHGQATGIVLNRRHPEDLQRYTCAPSSATTCSATKATSTTTATSTGTTVHCRSRPPRSSPAASSCLSDWSTASCVPTT